MTIAYRTALASLLAALALAGLSSLALAANPTDGTYVLRASVISAGGGEALSTNGGVWHTTGQSSAIGASSNGSYQNFPGFWEVPEPSPSLLQTVALLSLAALRRRRRLREPLKT